MRVRLGIEPAPIISASEDERHAIVDFSHQLICIGGDDCERSDPLTRSRVLPILPNATNAERIAVSHGDGIWLFRFALYCLPFEEAVNRKDAAALSVGIAECRQRGHGLALRVD